MNEKILNRITKSTWTFIAFLLWIWFCVTTIMFLLYSVFLDNEPLKKIIYATID